MQPQQKSSKLFTFCHAVHGGIVSISNARNMRDAIVQGRVKELIGCTLDDVVSDLPECDRGIWIQRCMQGFDEVYERQSLTQQAQKKRNVVAAKSGRRLYENNPPTGGYDPRLDDLCAKHKGAPAFILASGPSLQYPVAKKGLDKLRKLKAAGANAVVLAVNRSVMYFEECDYIAVMDWRLYGGTEPSFKQWNELFIGQEHRMIVQNESSWPVDKPFYRVTPIPEQMGFSVDLRIGFYRNYTTALLAVQAAVFMGCDPVYYAGVDLKHDKKNTHAWGREEWNAERDGDVKAGSGLFAGMASGFEIAAHRLQGVCGFYNLNNKSALRKLPTTTWAKALKPIGVPNDE